MTDIQTLLADYVDNGSETAFRELVDRYIDLVYTTAVRLVDGDTHRAEDVAQTVFINLAREAKNFSKQVKLGGWLHRNTCFVAANVLRSERRREARERHAIEMNVQTDHSQARLEQLEPILDDAINRLGATDRAAVLLRFYEKLDFRQVAEALGTTEAAAQKRVTRALEKLHLLLKHRGVVCSAVALGAALSANASSVAPTGLAASVSVTALGSVAAGTGTVPFLLKFMATTKLKLCVISAVVVASAVTPLLLQNQAQARIRAQDTALERNANQLAQLAAENQRFSSLLEKETGPVSDPQLSEVLKLRNEVGRLRTSVQQMTPAKAAPVLSAEEKLVAMKKMYAAQVDRLRGWFEANPSEKIPELRDVSEQTWVDAVHTLAKDDEFARAARILRINAQHPMFDKLFGASQKYAEANHGNFPSDLSDLKPYLRAPIDDAVLERYEIVRTSSLVSELRAGGEEWAITQKAPVNPALDIRMAVGLKETRMADERVTNRWTEFH